YALGAALAGAGTLAVQIAQKYQLGAAFAATGTLQCGAAFPAMSPVRTGITTTGSYTYNIPYWCRYIDYAYLPGGGGGGGAQFSFTPAQGGDGGQWVYGTWERGVDFPWTATQITGSIGVG
ncbi:hypothetical protein RA993_23075, partial [Mycobacteroides abscessus subsp. abscessus]